MADGVAAVRKGVPWRVIGWGAAVALILTPLAAMQFTREVNWTLGDFVFAILMIGGVGLLFEAAVRASASRAYRGAVTLGLAAAFLLIWINGAVGIIGDEDDPFNFVFVAIVGVAIAGSIIARGKAALMARVMAVAAAAQALVGMFVVASGIGAADPPGAIGLFIVIEFFAALWLGSAFLFQRAAREA